jgi:hypothetical protein
MFEEQSSGARRLVVSVARSSAFVPLARAILGRIGYAIVPLDEWAASPVLQELSPECALVDPARFGELPTDRPFDRMPLILITGREGAVLDDPRVLGAVQRPAGLHELYRLLQLAIEEHPRCTPRVPTNLPARVMRDEHSFTGSVLSLSENGCLLRTPEPVPLGSQLQIAFDLPQGGRIETEAQTSYQLMPDLGLVFERTHALDRQAIQSFVERQLGP